MCRQFRPLDFGRVIIGIQYNEELCNETTDFKKLKL